MSQSLISAESEDLSTPPRAFSFPPLVCYNEVITHLEGKICSSPSCMDNMPLCTAVEHIATFKRGTVAEKKVMLLHSGARAGTDCSLREQSSSNGRCTFWTWKRDVFQTAKCGISSSTATTRVLVHEDLINTCSTFFFHLIFSYIARSPCTSRAVCKVSVSCSHRSFVTKVLRCGQRFPEVKLNTSAVLSPQCLLGSTSNAYQHIHDSSSQPL
ncbi:hypothetical protein NPIL_293451 [Nephila pilipes]|uniref:Uncharacterized protein n=1 Tax=Nephila pilipes TaxID=299642 RepID=A0A8X6QY92_NEPPI|nr:hypothetical protein NPIL_293451 [Nephila pilipes]